MINAVSGENELKQLTITHLKTCMNVEHNAFKKSVRKAVLDHYEEVNLNQNFQFSHDGATLLNKDNHQAFEMQFVDAKIRHNNTVILSFRKH